MGQTPPLRRPRSMIETFMLRFDAGGAPGAKGTLGAVVVGRDSTACSVVLEVLLQCLSIFSWRGCSVTLLG